MPKVQRIFKVIHTRSDRAGNMLIVEEEPEYGNRKVYVHLTGEEHPRLIGEIDRRNKVMFVKRNRAKHLHNQMNAYGFNWVVINETKQFHHVLMMVTDGDDQTYYMIPVEVIKNHGTVKNFLKTGFELQVFLKVEYLPAYLTKQKFIKGQLT